MELVHWAGELPEDYLAARLEFTFNREKVTCPECLWILDTLDRVNERRPTGKR